VDNDLKRGERCGSPVNRNEGKELVFNLVPFECGRRIMGHGDGKL
jgi:hypothetical protein